MEVFLRTENFQEGLWSCPLWLRGCEWVLKGRNIMNISMTSLLIIASNKIFCFCLFLTNPSIIRQPSNSSLFFKNGKPSKRSHLFIFGKSPRMRLRQKVKWLFLHPSRNKFDSLFSQITLKILHSSRYFIKKKKS